MNDKARLLHILDAIAFVETFLENKSKDIFFENPQLRFAVERQLEIIGEAANHLSAPLKVKYDGIDWRKIVALEIFWLTNTLALI